MIKNVNTIEEYKILDKGAILNQAARTVRFRLPSSLLQEQSLNLIVDMGCYKRWHYIFLSLATVFIHHDLLRRSQKVQIHVFVRFPGFAL